MNAKHFAWLALLGTVAQLSAQDLMPAFLRDPKQDQERTCFQTSQPWNENGNLRSDVAIVYGIDAGLPARIQTWRDHGYRIHVMTGVSWGNYQDYLYGRFDGVNHEDEAQTRAAKQGNSTWSMGRTTTADVVHAVAKGRQAGAQA